MFDRKIIVKGKQFVCKDIKLMTFLILRGHKLIGFSEDYKKNNNHLVWYFEMSDKLKEYVAKWYDCDVEWISYEKN